MNKSARFDYEHEYYEMKVRIVRFRISEDTYECIVTKLGWDEFSSDEPKLLDHIRNEERVFEKLNIM